MTKMAAMPIYGKNPSKIIFSETNRLISRKLGVRHRWLKYSKVYINHDPVMTLTKFMARSTWVACASELGKLLKCHLKEKANRKLANGQNIEDSEKRKWPKGLSVPALELNTIIFKHVYWYMQLISGERLQDHWSSGYFISKPIFNLFVALFRTHELQKDGMVISFLWCFRKVRFKKMQFLKGGVQTVIVWRLNIQNSYIKYISVSLTSQPSKVSYLRFILPSDSSTFSKSQAISHFWVTSIITE